VKEIQKLEKQIVIERRIEQSAAKIAQIYKAGHDKAHKRDAKQTASETESKVEGLTKTLREQQALLRLHEPTVGINILTQTSMVVTFVVRSVAQRAEWMNDIRLHRQARTWPPRGSWGVSAVRQ
jgi:hypothetical protein